MADVLGYVKEHPYQTGAVAVVGLVAVYFVLSGGSSGTPVSGTDPNTLALEAHQLDVQAASQAQSNQLNAQILALQQQGANDIAIATINAHTQGDLAKIQSQTLITQDQLAAELGIDQIQGQIDQAKLQADVANNTINTQGMVQLAQTDAAIETTRINADTARANVASTNAAQVNIAGINAQTQQFVAQVTGTTQQQISTNQANVAIEQTRANVEIAKTVTQGGVFGKLIGAVAGVAGAIL